MWRSTGKVCEPHTDSLAIIEMCVLRGEKAKVQQTTLSGTIASSHL